MAERDVRETMFEFQAAALYEKKDNLNLKHVDHGSWMKMEDHINVEDEDAITLSSESSVGEYTTSVNSQGSTSCSSDLVDDASSSTSNSCSSNNNNNNEGPLYELSELMAHLPIKRGLSKFYQGKTQSFTSLSSVKSLEDLAKKESSTSYLYRKCKGVKGCKSYGGGLDHHKLYTLPTPTISKKVSRRSTFLNGRPPLIPLQSNFSSL